MASPTKAAQPTDSQLANGAYWLIWIVLLVLPIIILWPHLPDYAWNYDEGVLLQTAALSNQGFPLFEETVFNKPPLIIWWLQAAFKLGGTAVSTARVSIMAINLGGLAALGWLAASWWRQRWAGPLAVGLWLLMPDALVRFSVVMNDLPGMSLLLLTLAAVTRFRQTNKWRWTAVTGILFALTIGFHPLLLFMGLPILFLMFWGKPIDKQSGQAIGWFGFFVLLTTAVWLLPSYGEGFIRWVVAYNQAKLGPDLLAKAATNGKTLAQFLLHKHWLLLILALFSAGHLYVAKKRIALLTAVLWLALTIFALLRLSPMWSHYMFLTLYPPILLIAGGVATAGQKLWHMMQNGKKRPLFQTVPLWLSIGLFGLLVQQYAKQPTVWFAWSHSPAKQYLINQIAPQQMIISDNPFLIFAGGHLVPPPLTDGSSKRISAGYLTSADVLNTVFAYKVDYFVFTNGRFNQLPALQEWVETQSVEQISFGETTVYRLKQPPALQIATNSQLDPGISLDGYTINQTGASIALSLYWQTAVPLPANYHRFIHLLDENGGIVTQLDGIPLNGWLPTNQWQPHVPMVDSITLTLPTNLAPGIYTLVTGMYTFPEIRRLPATNTANGRWPNDAIPLQEIIIP